MFSDMTDEVQIALSTLCCQQGFWKAEAGRVLLVLLVILGRYARMRVVNDGCLSA